MPLAFNNRSQARLFVGDTGGLMNDVIQAARRRHLTSLLAAMHLGSTLLYIPRHVLIEIERDLAEYASRPRRRVKPEDALHWWRTWYAPWIRVVDVPDTWGTGDPRVDAVGSRHDPFAPPDKFSDVPTARLAIALADCFLICRDGDLTDYAFGRHEHLELLHAAANEGERRYVNEMMALPMAISSFLLEVGIQGLRRLPAIAQIGFGIGVIALGFLWQRDGLAARQLKQVGATIGTVLQVVTPVLLQIAARSRENEPVWPDHLVRRNTPPSASEQVARVLAFAPDTGMLAAEIAREIQSPDSIKKRAAAVRVALKESTAFTQVSHGRWRLGHPVTEKRSALNPLMIADWMKRAHPEIMGHLQNDEQQIF